MDREPVFADIIVDLPVKNVDRAYQYSVPPHLREKTVIGATAVVNFNNRRMIGFIVGIGHKQLHKQPSKIIDIVDEPPVVDDNVLAICRWLSSYYLAPFSDCIKLFLTPGRLRRLRERYRVTDEPFPESDAALLAGIKEREANLTKKKILELIDQKTLTRLIKSGFIRRSYELMPPKTSVKKIKMARLKRGEVVSGALVKGEKQLVIVDFLGGGPMAAADILKATGASYSTLKSLETRGVVEIYQVEADRMPDSSPFDNEGDILHLTDGQLNAVEAIGSALAKKEPAAFLLDGVTGSGKTEVYLRSTERTLKEGRTAIVLVPEIALTPQLTDRFRGRFGDRVAVIHSGLTPGQRYDQWRKLKSGEASIAIGARSALFAPLDNIGLIVIDEEHETSYKQNRAPRYNARDVAGKLAEIHGGVLVLGSATPAIETLAAARSGHIGHLLLPNRVGGRDLPAINIVDMRLERQKENFSVFSVPLIKAMKACRDREEKMILFINRRGFSSFLLCPDCGHVPKCRNCAVSLTYHQTDHRLVCHHCRYNETAPSICPQCGSQKIRFFGVGTQRVETELKVLFPESPIIRMDADSTGGRDAHRQLLARFDREPAAILLGTQMVAKGLDFPQVSLVGVVNADIALNLPDFRAGERTYQLLMQVAGRSGRGETPGEVYLQTYSPENYAIAAAGGGSSFYEQELEFRRQGDYPPFTTMINIIFSGSSEELVRLRAEAVIERLRRSIPSQSARLFGPGPAPIPRIKNRWRWHLFLTTSRPDRVKSIMEEEWGTIFGDNKDTNIIVDVDPSWLL